MKTVIVSCRTVEDEVNAAIKQSGVDYPVEWLESGLHNQPNILLERLQELLDSLEAERVLLAMGFCGNSLKGLKLGAYELIVPRVDDCISLLLGGVDRRIAVTREYAAYFFTEGWMRGERNIWEEYKYTVEQYGEEMAETVMEMMYSHYRTLALLDTGAGDVEKLSEQVKPLAEALHLERKTIPATLDYCTRLFLGPWDEESFVRFAPFTVVEERQLTLPGGVKASLQ